MGKGSSKFFHRTSSKPTNKIANYNLDGTGRDTYIKNSNGGFYPEKETTGLKKTFFDKLRSYERPSTAQYLEKRKKRTVKLTSDGKLVADKDIFMNSQGFISHQHTMEQRETFNYLKEQSQRLSQPKLKILIPGSPSQNNSLSRNSLTTAASPAGYTFDSVNLLSRNAPSNFDSLTQSLKTIKLSRKLRQNYPPLHSTLTGHLKK